MAPTRGVGRFIAIVAIASTALQTNAQTISSAPTSATLTSSGQSTITSASSVNAASSSTDEPLALWSEARTLLSSYYPSTTLTQVASLTWPSAVVIGSSTFSVPPKSTGTPVTSVLAESTTAATPVASQGMRSDEKVGVGIGVAVGAVALIVLGLIFCVLHKRRKASGTFFKRRATPSVTDSDVEAWRSPMSRQSSTRSYGPSRDWMQQYNRMSEAPAAGHLQPPPMAMHPAFVRQHTSRSTSEENPFFTPSESPDYSMTGAGSGAAVLGAHNYRNTDTPSHASTDSSRTPEPQQPRSVTPFSPTMMSTSWAQRMHDDPQHQNPYHNQYHNDEPLHLPPPNHNPFASPEDEDEMTDIVSPIIPARSPERRHSPMVHYPSWSEVSSFDFAGEGARGVGRDSRASRSEPVSLEGSGGEGGWRPVPGRGDSMYGRSELA
ncbi:hypothetical protein LTS16_026130 [Friedmanniomyces endolithicus]|nr:hypothetical protein LTR59_017577 [Friedmanniomyces endolithicus]KAK0784620.1 hypothetical protein LTR75_013757 [Friedmanniomyces endolithicus]KAK0922431.1 hypothetical protein LTR57_007671 [Friedmanniomyces endolithicus]KAK1021923.1 hypothetical protein LTS16_026130 [Friedmanniomyces endolithicus]